MAEGHAVVRWARTLQAVCNQPLIDVAMPKRWTARVPALIGTYVRDIETRGKHLLLHLSNDQTIHTHAMQYGSWQVGERPMALRKEAKYVRLRLVTSSHEAVFYHGPVIELLSPEELTTHSALLSLGPDVMAPDFDRIEAARRIVEADQRPIGDVILDQRVVAGLGNIFKSEGLFLARINPRKPASTVKRDELEQLWDEIIPIMQQGTERYGKTATTSSEMRDAGTLHYVYRRLSTL